MERSPTSTQDLHGNAYFKAHLKNGVSCHRLNSESHKSQGRKLSVTRAPTLKPSLV